MTESLLQPNLFVSIENFGSDVFDNRQVLIGRTEILSQSEDRDIVISEIIHGLQDFLFLFSQSEHNTTLRCAAISHFPGHPLRGLQDEERTPVFCLVTNEWSETLHGLHVVIKNLRSCFHHNPERIVFSDKVWDEDLDDRSRVDLASLINRIRKVTRADVGEVAREYLDIRQSVTGYLTTETSDSLAN